MGAEFFFMRTDRQADMTKLVVAFRNFANAPKNGLSVFVDFLKSRPVAVDIKKVITSNPLKLTQAHTAHMRMPQQFLHVESTFCALALHIRGTESCVHLITVQERCTVCSSASVAVFF